MHCWRLRLCKYSLLYWIFLSRRLLDDQVPFQLHVIDYSYQLKWSPRQPNHCCVALVKPDNTANLMCNPSWRKDDHSQSVLNNTGNDSLDSAFVRCSHDFVGSHKLVFHFFSTALGCDAFTSALLHVFIHDTRPALFFIVKPKTFIF